MVTTHISRGPPVSFRDRTAFFVSVASTLALLLNGRFGTSAMAIFIGLWGLYILAWPRFSSDALPRALLPWCFPLFALASTSWSLVPDMTARIAIEWLLTTGIAVLMVRSLPAERLLASWMIALVPVVVAGAFMGGSQFTETREIASIGTFGSKNNFALHVSMMLLVCLAVLADAKQRRLFRLIALCAIGVGPLLLWRSRSIGALVVFLPALILLCAIVVLGKLPSRLRPIAVAGALAIAVALAAAAVPVVMASMDDLFASVGKTADLTGRGLLWQRAATLIEQRPVLGVGYSAFWVQGNPEAEALWRIEHIDSRFGFHFHRFYYNTAVELGYTGLAVGAATFFATILSVLAWGVRKPGPVSGFFCAIMLFLLLRSFVELDLGGGFALTTLMLPVAWLYATTKMVGAARVATREFIEHRVRRREQEGDADPLSSMP